MDKRIARGVAASLLLFAASCSRPSAIHDEADTVEKASDAFVKQAGDTAHTAPVPRAGDPAVKPLVDTVFDTRPTGAPTPGDMEDVSNWMLAIVKAGGVYIFAGTGISNFAEAAKSQDLDKLQAQTLHNTVQYASEIGRFFDAELALYASLLDSVQAQLQSDAASLSSEKAQQGLAKMKGGAAQTVYGMLTTLPTEGLTDDWRRARLDAAKPLAPKIDAFVEADQRKLVHDTALQVAQQMTDPVVKADLDDIATTFAK